MDILQEIIAMDKAASERVEKLREEQSAQLDESGAAAAKERDELLAGERRGLEEFREEQEKLLSEKKAATDAARKEQIERLDKIFEAHRSEWRSEIMQRVMGS